MGKLFGCYGNTKELDFVEPKKSLVFGVELEVNDNLNKRDAIAEAIKGFGIVKSEHCGIEIVTKPMTVRQHLKVWSKVFPLLKGSGTRSCGFHVHINRAALSLKKEKELLKYFHTVKPDNLRRIGGRKPNSWAVQKKRPIKALDEFKTKEDLNENCGLNDHYAILSVSGTNDGRTLEMRAFKSTENYRVFCKRLRWLELKIKSRSIVRKNELNVSDKEKKAKVA